MSIAAGRRLFEARRFFAAHEAFEDGWRLARGDEKRVLQGLVLWAAALHHYDHGRGGGARRLIARALERLGRVNETFPGIDVDSLQSAVLETWGQLASGEEVVPRWPEAPTALPWKVALDHSSSCPYCGEPVQVSVAMEEVDGAAYIEDCPVCCRPWAVTVSRAGHDVAVEVRRLDA